jgi:hypothetical protein
MGAPAPMPQQTAAPQPQLPEQQGIGVLPAQNVEGMADGGIAGYGDSYADEYAGGGMVAFGRGGDVPGFAGGEFIDYGIPISYGGVAGGEEYFNKPVMPYGEQMRNVGNALTNAFRRIVSDPTLDEKDRAEAKAKLKAAEAAIPPATPADVRRVDNAIDASTAPPQVPKVKTGTATRPGAGTTTGPRAEKAPDSVSSQPGDLAAELKRLQAMNPGTKAYDALNDKIKQGFADLEKAREEGKPKEKAYTGLEALLGNEEEKAKGREARNFNMAIVNSGLAIAGGESQYALQNIAKGAQVGTKQYQEGLDKLEAAALERRKQSAMIEEARRAEARGDWKEEQQFKQKAFEAGLSVEQAQIAAVQDLYKTDIKTAAELVNNQRTLASADQRAREQNVSAERVAGIYANSRLGGGAGLRGKITDDDIYKAYNRNMEKDTWGDFKKDFPDFASYRNHILQQMSGQGAQPVAPGGIKFLGFEK